MARLTTQLEKAKGRQTQTMAIHSQALSMIDSVLAKHQPLQGTTNIATAQPKKQKKPTGVKRLPSGVSGPTAKTKRASRG